MCICSQLVSIKELEQKGTTNIHWLVGWMCAAGQRFFACVFYISKIVSPPM